ncbi:MAG: Re/Si-specific NAD(P)(+) transhydrogenase subunit alpha [marine benthic group bacterium]|nr:Re/Si-specific NAD(P)(+) transhydrogenase subunit alpha [Gemmatimonadota bacterium]
MRIVVPKEHAPGERRVAMSPSAISRLASDGMQFVVESGAGLAASHSDEEYREAGAEIVADPKQLFDGADVVVKVNGPVKRDDGTDEVELIPSGALLIGQLQPHANAETLERLAERGVTSFSMELMPRTTLAQRMDSLSAFSTVAGYNAVLRGAAASSKFFPMLTTAAGTIAPANVFIIGAGVAGLQAIATARRLGAVVEAFDIRPAAKEQVQSLGANFVEWQGSEDTETEGGYAKEVSEEEQEHERQLLAEHIAKSDVVITTALVPGRKAPVLITADMVEGMRPGSVIVDLAAPAGGNCELTEPGETVVRNGVLVMGPQDLAAAVPLHGSQMYGKVLSNLLNYLVDDEGQLVIDLENDITGACVVTHDGTVRYES